MGSTSSGSKTGESRGKAQRAVDQQTSRVQKALGTCPTSATNFRRFVRPDRDRKYDARRYLEISRHSRERRRLKGRTLVGEEPNREVRILQREGDGRERANQLQNSKIQAQLS